MNKLKMGLKKLSRSDVLEILFHPAIIPFAMIPAWARSLWNARVLLWGQWSHYHGFHASHAINCLFYRTQWININHYGRLSRSPILGLGNFSLTNLWHLSALASYFYANAAALTTVLGTIIIIASHLVWIETKDWVWVLVVSSVYLFSSTTYVMAFSRQNYQILGWIFFPLGLFGILNGVWLLSCVAIFISAMLSVTAFVVWTYIITVYSLYYSNYEILLQLLPAGIFSLINFLPYYIFGNTNLMLAGMAKLIGLSRFKVRYKRKSMRLGVVNIYWILFYGSSLSVICYTIGEVPILLLSVILLFIFNQMIMRFADDQSMIITISMVAMVEVMVQEYSMLSLIGLVFILNPMLKPLVAGGYSRPEIFAPFDVEPLLIKLREFLNISSGERVIFAFSDPSGVYENIFDGYRVLLEAPLVVAAEKKIHLFPDWYAVWETNYDGAQQIWGREIYQIKSNMNYWGASYAVIYTDTDSQLSTDFLDSFEVISEFDWLSVYSEKTVRNMLQKPVNPPKWWLVKQREMD